MSNAWKKWKKVCFVGVLYFIFAPLCLLVTAVPTMICWNALNKPFNTSHIGYGEAWFLDCLVFYVLFPLFWLFSQFEKNRA